MADQVASLLQFEKLFDELNPHLEDILAANHLGVAVAMAESCQKLGVKQGKFKNVSRRFFSANWERALGPLLLDSLVVLSLNWELRGSAMSINN